MTNGKTTMLTQVRKLVAAQVYRELGDAQLLDRFRDQHDEAAFAALMERHGAMVLGVCRRVLGNHHDAEDACQATFLVLARKSSSIRKKGSLGSWLHGAAFRIASDLKKRLTRRGSPDTKRKPSSAMAADIDVSWREVQCILYEELARLPDNYRLPVVLCCLEGKARDEAAQQAGWSMASFRGRLDRGREMLRARLLRRGVTLSVAMLGTVLAGNGTAASLPPTLALATCDAAARFIAGKSVVTGAISATVASLTQRMVQTMFLTKLKLAAVVLMILLGASGAGMILADRTASAQASPPAAAEKPAAEKTGNTPAKQNEAKEKEPFTAWGAEVGGLQAGLGYYPGQRRTYSHGETVQLMVRVRNVGKKEVQFQYLRHFFIENPPTVTDEQGKRVAVTDRSPKGIYQPLDATLAPGKEVELYTLSLELSNDKGVGVPRNTTLSGPGKFSIQYERILGSSSLSSVAIKYDPVLEKLATGKLELEVQAERREGAREATAQPAQHDGAWDLRPPTKEPKYQKEARYALLVFGAKREQRVWMVLDGTTLYVDRNGNGDLNEPGERLEPDNPKDGSNRFGGSGSHTHFDIFEFTVQVGATGTGKFQLHHWIRAENFTPKTDFDKQLHARWLKLRWENSTLWRKEGQGQGQTPLLFMPKPADAQVCALDGPLTFVVRLPEHQVLKRGAAENDVAFCIAVKGRPPHGAEQAFHNPLATTEVPENAHLEVEVEYPAKTANDAPLRRKYLLKQRC